MFSPACDAILDASEFQNIQCQIFWNCLRTITTVKMSFILIIQRHRIEFFLQLRNL
jgi:hypothetical protein